MDTTEPRFRIKGYALSPELFRLGYASGAGPCACATKCCHRGAYIDLGERDRILKHAAAIAPHMDETQSREPADWFEPAELVDRDFVSGKCVGTAVVSGKCALLDKRGYCSLQVMANEAGLHKWAIKPIYCVMFPIEVIDGEIRFNAALQGKQSCCSVQASFDTPLFEACREELVHLIGEDGYAAVAEHYQQSRSQAQT